ncbi:hypothetical protein NPIL_362811 [Nephila pilipes]|uniref:Uncharacterized protein n=1 Tax=Nephila pilipes TaxID=299642 RepID=A0A8X6P477_NEPPI|nr:hypothetical protein NPIL_362811 [Nephila pilipes]
MSLLFHANEDHWFQFPQQGCSVLENHKIELEGQEQLFILTGLSFVGKGISFAKGILQFGLSPKYQQFLLMFITIPDVFKTSTPSRVRFPYACGRKNKSV